MSSWADKTKGTSTVCKTIPQRELVLSWWRLATGCLFSENSKTRRYTMKSRSRWFVQRLEFKSYFVSLSQKSYHGLQRQKPWMRNCRTFIWHEILNSVFNNNRYASKWTAECILKFEMCLKHHGAKWHFGGRHRKSGNTVSPCSVTWEALGSFNCFFTKLPATSELPAITWCAWEMSQAPSCLHCFGMSLGYKAQREA